MKAWKKLAMIALSAVCAASVFAACETPGQGGKQSTISPALLDGKVANLLSAEGIAIENKEGGTSSETAYGAATVSAFRAGEGDESSKEGRQAVNEFVKTNGKDVRAVRFHERTDDCRELNGKYGKHHHGGTPCEEKNCGRASDELEEEEESLPSVVSLDARVNKLYSYGDFTFLNVSAAVTGSVRVVTRTFFDPKTELLALAESGLYPTYLNIENSMDANGGTSYAISYIKVKKEEKEGMILVRASKNESDYHVSNYWSDDFNQSYLIDNTTGKTYSLAQFPYIYSVEEGVLKVYDRRVAGMFAFYVPKIEDGALRFDKIALPMDNEINQLIDGAMFDRYGNVVFTSYFVQNRPLQVDKYGEMKLGDKLLFTSVNMEIYREIQRINQIQGDIYARCRRYQKGEDNRIYRIDYHGDFRDMPVSVLNEDCEWEPVTGETEVTFALGYFMYVNHFGGRGELVITKISGGKLFMANAMWGNNFYSFFADWMKPLDDRFIGVAAFPVAGGEDEAMTSFVKELEEATSESRPVNTVFRVGDTCVIYRMNGGIYRWDRLTEKREKLADGRCRFINASCFEAADRYIPFDASSAAADWESFPTEPVEYTVQFEEYYAMLRNIAEQS